jgi:hypothetical protein
MRNRTTIIHRVPASAEVQGPDIGTIQPADGKSPRPVLERVLVAMNAFEHTRVYRLVEADQHVAIAPATTGHFTFETPFAVSGPTLCIAFDMVPPDAVI